MNISEFVIRRKTLISMLFIALVLLGVVSYKQLAVELYPNAELPFLIVQVRTVLEMDPRFIEQQAIVPLEGAVSSLQDVQRIESYVERNGGVIYVYLNKNANTKYAYLKLDERVNRIKAALGEEFYVAVIKIDTEQLSNIFMGLQVRGGGGVERVREVTDQKITRELENVQGVANVEVYGGQERSVEIILDRQTCEAYGITPSQIRSLITQNSAAKRYVGRTFIKEHYLFTNLVADYTDIKDLENIVVRSQGPVLLRDVATVFFGVKTPTSKSRVNGKDAITIQLMRDSQVNLIALAHDARATISRLNEKLAPLDVEIVIQSDAAEDIEKNIDLIIQLAIFGGVLAVGVLWLFLRRIKWVMIITLAIPISIYTAFNLFYAADISINSLTLVGIALAVGMLLDNSVVVMENIYRLVSRGYERDQAVTQGANEVWRSILASTLTTITVFVPFVFAENFLIRLLGKHIGISIVSTLIISLLVALLLIPMLMHAMLRTNLRDRVHSFQILSRNNRLLQIYHVILKSCMRYPARTIITAVFIFFASLIIALAVSVNVSEEVETREFNIYVTMGEGSTLDRTDLLVADIEKQIESLEEKEEIISTISESDAIVTVRLVKDFQKIKHRSLQKIKENVQERMEGITGGEISFEQPIGGGRYRGGSGRTPGLGLEQLLGIGTPSERVVIKGRDFAAITRLAEEVRSYLDELDSIQRTGMSASTERPEVHLHFDHMMMNAYGIDPQQVAGDLSSFQGEFSSNLTYKQGEEEYDITIRSDSVVDKSLDDLRNFPISTSSGELVDLQDFSRLILSTGSAGIQRINQEKEVQVTYQFLSEITDSKELLVASREEIDELIAKIPIPSGMAVEVVHEETDLSDFKFLIAVAFILIYMILAAVFESLATPIVMMFTIPLAAIGSLWALILTGNSILNANTLIGFLILIGVVVNNGIIFIDYTRILRNRGYTRSRALMTAGQTRVRPILITAITTIIAMLPLAMEKIEYVAKIGAPFAITVIGGLALSTLFTLVFIPTFYSGFENALRWIRSQKLIVKLIQLAVFILGIYLIYAKLQSLLWQLFYLFLLIVLIPGLTYFIQVSLRRANSKILSKDEALVIEIRRLVKIYNQSSRFVREWKRGRGAATQGALGQVVVRTSHWDDLIWQLGVLALLVYFTYFYLASYFWTLFFSIVLYIYILHLWKTLIPILNLTHIDDAGHRILFWGIPALDLAYFLFQGRSPASVIFIGILFYLTLTIRFLSSRLQRNQVNIPYISGRFAQIRRSIYRFVEIIPVIGRKKHPFRALDGVSLTIGSGMFGLLGPNGAGKTTLMRIICGIFEQSRGKIFINQIDLQHYREEMQDLIGYLPQEFGMYENMTAFEFLDYQAMLKGIRDVEERRNRIQYVLAAVHMDERQHDKISSYSGGMKQRIGIAQTLLHLPRILVVDEPTAGLDPRERIRFRNLLVELSRERIVIFSTHIIEDISSSCNQVAVLNQGKLKFWGAPVEMAKLAEGKVWQFLIAEGQFESLQKRLLVVHHIRVGDMIRVRCVTEQCPAEDAVPVNPSLEDAYLWLLKGK